MKNFLPQFEYQNSEPTIIVGIRWGFNLPLYFATKAIKVLGENARPTITNVGTYTNAKTANNQGSTASMSVTIKDVDGVIKAMMDGYRTEKSGAAIYLAFENQVMVLVSGEVIGPIGWTEGTRDFTFEVGTVIESKELGFSPTLEDYEDIAPSAEGQPWPMIFGKCAHVKAVKARQHTAGYLKSDIILDSLIIDKQGSTRLVFCREGKGVTVKSYSDGDVVDNELYVEGGSLFPQEEEIKIIINGVVFVGTMLKEVFTVTTANYPKFENIKFGPRPEEKVEDYKVAYLTDADVAKGVNIQGCHVYMKGVDANASARIVWHNFCIKQEGKKCTFKDSWLDSNNADKAKRKPITIDGKFTIERAYTVTEFGCVGEDAGTIYNHYKTPATQGSNFAQQGRQIASMLASSPAAFFKASSGEKVKLYDREDPDIYICSWIELDEINAVYGKKTIKSSNGKERKVFAPIPKIYYEKQLQSNYEVNGQLCSALLFYSPLSDYIEEGWDDDIYITATSTVGPNPADIIEWIINNYTNLSPVRSRFSSVRAKLAQPVFPPFLRKGQEPPESNRADFAITNQQDAMTLAKSIAWQCRCALRIDLGQVDIVYLADIPTTHLALSEDNTERDSLMLDFSETTDIRTCFRARWRETYRHQRNFNTKGKLKATLALLVDEEDRDERIIVYKNNVNDYGSSEEEFDIFIYNQDGLVRKTVNYWGYIQSNSWRRMTVKTFHHGLNLQPWDGVLCQYQNSQLQTLQSLIGVVESVKYDPGSKSVTLVIWLASRAGYYGNDYKVWED